MREVVRLKELAHELAATLHDLAHIGDMKECPDEFCQQYKPKDDET